MKGQGWGLLCVETFPRPRLRVSLGVYLSQRMHVGTGYGLKPYYGFISTIECACRSASPTVPPQPQLQ